ncbi:hypothetical protein E8D34_05815 [Nocardioides sp. GY 10113]|uniref:hypothetical protein n=1 Tax=Nocardioides sp. GY 10113 TaxID=2569761 RepID=UPI0010A82B91|nr:hypothetical protein [Nocardioides sp. GY 10113]TIC88436.1 hypothetical protein E8D34_05815 [Nocardioides sp. GY 10113]
MSAVRSPGSAGNQGRAGDRSGARDQGYVMVVVVVSMTVLIAMLTVVLGYSRTTIKTVRNAADWNQALQAADAGVADYLARLNADDNYWQGVDCTNVALKGPTSRTNTCGWNATTPPGWADLPGSGAQYHYEVDVSSTPSNGTVVLTSSGRSRGENRTIQVRMRRGGFGEFLYYTVYETVDPENEAVYGYKNTTAISRCTKYYYQGRDTSYCSDINFVSGDVIDGPLHTNDAMLMYGTPRFNGTTTTSWPSCTKSNPSTCYRRNGSPSPTFAKGIAYRDPVQLPESIGDLRQYVDPTQPNPGCLYTGPTRIKIVNGSGTTPSTMRVWSPWTTSTNSGCGTVPLNGSAAIPIPHNSLIYVQNVPATQTAPVSGKTNPGTGACPGGWIGDGFPLAGTTTSGDYNQTLDEAKCTYGTVYVEGTLKGRLSIAAEANVVITGDLTYSGGRTGTDALGLLANESVKIYHPVRCTSYSSWRKECSSGSNLNRPSGSTFTDPEVNAAILTLRHSFTVQQYQFGSRLGDLSLFGTIAQRFRGPVGTTNTSGYLKKYVYDTRMRYAPPPYFLDPVRSAWGVKTYGELVPRY